MIITDSTGYFLTFCSTAGKEALTCPRLTDIVLLIFLKDNPVWRDNSFRIVSIEPSLICTLTFSSLLKRIRHKRN